MNERAAYAIVAVICGLVAVFVRLSGVERAILASARRRRREPMVLSARGTMRPGGAAQR